MHDEQRYSYVVIYIYVLVTGHITIGHILRKNESMRSEPQSMVLVLDIITPKLPRLNRFYAPFPKNYC